VCERERERVCACVCVKVCMYTCECINCAHKLCVYILSSTSTHTRTNTNTHAHTLSLSISLSHTHTNANTPHTHTHAQARSLSYTHTHIYSTCDHAAHQLLPPKQHLRYAWRQPSHAHAPVVRAPRMQKRHHSTPPNISLWSVYMYIDACVYANTNIYMYV